MPILYSLVSRGNTVLAEYTATLATGNFPTVTRMLLAKIPAADGKMTYVYDDYVFHYVVESGICYLCMSDEKNKHRLPYAFLQDMKDLFLGKFGMDAAHRAIAFSFNEEFSPIIQQRMDHYNSGGAMDNIDALKNQIDDVKEGMVQNIEKVLERGEKIELLVDKTDRLNQQAFRFESTSRNLRRHMYWRKIRNVGICSAVAFIVIFILVAEGCGGIDFIKCRK
uniref:V-SNARE coiled-coil homology domain-containing protein n=2 Tax=Chaetoceros debilis TaxID=122233 RepID=A0A7S3Q5V1_9STRA